jgi:hypothetical protein
MSARAPSMPVIVILVAVVVVAILAVITFVRPPGTAKVVRSHTTFPTAPNPAMNPEQVVSAILAALRDNDPETDDGVRTTFAFASPANQAMTGPVDRFVAMVKQPPFALLINHRSARVTPMKGDESRAIDLVRVVGRDGHRIYFAWELSKQTADGPLKDCWRTDGVRPVRPPPGEDEPEERI